MPVGRRVLAAQYGFRLVDERCAKRRQGQNCRFEPDGANVPHPASCQLVHEQIACRGYDRRGGEIQPADDEKRLAFGKAAEHEERTDPAEQRQGKQRVISVKIGFRIAEVDEECGAEEKGEAEEIQ